MSMFLTRMIDEKKRYRQYKARTAQLPADYHAAVGALERYLMYLWPGTGEELLSMLEDLADLFEESAAGGTPIRSIVGEDPVEFAEAFRLNYPAGQFLIKERDRLTRAIQSVADGGKAP
jgi:DNA-binding ferritin-like protein (Dps family)